MDIFNNSKEPFFNQVGMVSWQETCLQEVWGQINSHIKNFIGREELLEELNHWIEVNSDGYFLLLGEAGLGKSALLAKFSQKQNNMCFIHISRSLKDPTRVLQFLIWQVSQMYEYDLSKHIHDNSLNSLRFYLISFLSLLLKEKNKIIFIIDNLDLLSISDLIKILPSNLPKNVYFFLASRETPLLLQVLKERLQKLTIKKLTPLSLKETRDFFNNQLISNQLGYLSKSIEFQLMLKVTTKLLLTESQNNITILKLTIEYIITQIKNSLAENNDLDIVFSKNNIKLSFVTIYNKLLLINKKTTKINQANLKELISIIAISYEILSVDELFEILYINGRDIKKEQIENYLSEIENYLIKLPLKRQIFFHHHFSSFVIDKLVETKEIILLYDLIINWLYTLKNSHQKRYFYYIDIYLLELSLISIKLDNKLKIKETLLKLFDLLINIQFVSNKINMGMLASLICTYKKVIEIIPEDIEISIKNRLLNWFKFLDSESYSIKQHSEINIFLQQAINQIVDLDISQQALNYLKETNLPYTYLYWLNKPSEHIYKSLKEDLVNNLVGIQAIKLTSDNKRLVTANEDGKIKVWDLLTKEELINLTDNDTIIFSLDIDLNNKYAVSGDASSKINIWDLTNKDLLLSLKEHIASVLSLKITRDNKYLISTSVDRSIKIWDFNLEMLIDKQAPLFELKGHDSIINALAITTDNQQLITGSNDGKIIIWNLINKEKITSLDAHDFGITSLAITTDNQYIISSSEDRTIKIWDLINKTLSATLRGATSSISKVKLTSDDKYIVAGSNDKTIHIWNLATGLPITVLTGHNDLITDIEITSNDKYIVSSGKDGDIKLWDLEYAKASIIETKYRFSISAIVISLDGTLGISAGTNGLIKIWNINNKSEIVTISTNKSIINALALTSDNKYLVSAGDDFQVKIWDLETLNCVGILSDHKDRILSLLITADNKYIISGSDDKTIKIWDLNKKLLNTTLVDKAGVYALIPGQDNRHFASANFRGKLRLWDLVTKRIVKEHKGWFDTKTATTRNNKYQVLRQEDNTLRVIDLANDIVIAIFPTISLVTHCSISDNGIILSCDQLGNLYFLKLEIN